MTSALHRYATRGHREVDGWLLDTAISLLLELGRIQDAHRVTGPVCEIGVHHGRLFILLHLLTRPDERSVAWDLFEHQGENIDRSGKGNKARFLANLGRHGCDVTRIDAVSANSLLLTPAGVRQTCGAAPRIFSIDGGHTADITHSDLILAAHSVSDNGLIVLDDFFNESWPGVAEGACRYFAAPAVPLFPVAIGGNKFIFTKSREMAAVYARELTLSDPAFHRRETTAFGEPVSVFTRPPRPLGTRVLGADRMRRLRKSGVGRVVRRVGRLAAALRRRV